MNVIKSLLLLALFSSCAHKGLEKSLHSSRLDGLRHESLNRYTNQDLEGLKGAFKSIALCHKGRYNEAFSQFKQDLDTNQNNPVYWNHLGTCYYLKGEYPKALIYLEISMKLTKKKKLLAAVYNNIGLVHLKQGNLPEAKASFKLSISNDKYAKTPRYNLAQLYLSRTNFNSAKQILEKLASQKPNDVDFNYSLGHLYLMKKQYIKALSKFDRIPEQYRKRDDVALNLATTFHLMGKHEEALKTLDSAPKTTSNFALQQVELRKRIEQKLNK
ncbi:MAG: tetratricopeptide repeat protein [Bacteriovoracaceae bacterium]|nr:tetratricopeptide repeat protein [Bacteriovoracaceae bacterium]